MKRTITFCLTICCFCVAIAAESYKVVEQNPKKIPGWVGLTETGYIIATSEGKTLDEAKQQCIESIKVSIIQSIAVNVTATTDYSASNNIKDGDLASSHEDFYMAVKTRAANFPYLQGISESKAEGSFWQKREEKKSKVVTFFYTMRYPFSNADAARYAREFEAMEREKMNKLTELKDELNTVTSVEMIASAINELELLATYFFDETRIAQTRNLQAAYRGLYSQIVVRTLHETPGEYVYALMLNEMPISCNLNPLVKQNDIKNIVFAREDMNYVVKYNYEDCEQNSDNEIDMTFKFGNRTLKHKVHFKAVDNAPHFKVVNTIMAKAQHKSGNQISGLSFVLDFDIANCKKVMVKEISLTVPGSIEQIDVAVNQEFEGGKSHRYAFAVDGAVNAKPQNGKTSFAQGSAVVVFDGNATQKIINFIIQCKPNW